MNLRNLIKKPKLELEDHEMICDNCKGTGYQSKKNGLLCPKCLGDGKLDWVENIIGKRRPSFENWITSSGMTNASISINNLPSSMQSECGTTGMVLSDLYSTSSSRVTTQKS